MYTVILVEPKLGSLVLWQNMVYMLYWCQNSQECVHLTTCSQQVSLLQVDHLSCNATNDAYNKYHKIIIITLCSHNKIMQKLWLLSLLFKTEKQEKSLKNILLGKQKCLQNAHLFLPQNLDYRRIKQSFLIENKQFKNNNLILPFMKHFLTQLQTEIKKIQPLIKLMNKIRV